MYLRPYREVHFYKWDVGRSLKPSPLQGIPFMPEKILYVTVSWDRCHANMWVRQWDINLIRPSDEVLYLHAHTRGLGLYSLKVWYCVDQDLYMFLFSFSFFFFFFFEDIVIFDIVFFFFFMTFYKYSLLLLFEHIHRYTHTSIDDIKWYERYVTKFRSVDTHKWLPPMLRAGIDETWCFMHLGIMQRPSTLWELKEK